MASSQALRRTEAKAFFANERTFLHWLNISVTVGSVAAAMLGVSGHVHKHWGSDFTMTAMAARLVALAMMVMAIFMAAYATFKFASRASLLKFKQDSGYEDKLLPIVTTVVMAIVLGSIFSGSVDTFIHSHAAAPPVPPPQPPPAPSPHSAAPQAAGVPAYAVDDADVLSRVRHEIYASREWRSADISAFDA